jgi:putative methylase
MRLRQLEILLERVGGYTVPSPFLEQYQTPAPVAARLLYHAFMNRDIGGKNVCDLGCGTGILSIGACLLGAASVTGADLDPAAIAAAERNAKVFDVRPVFFAGDVADPETAERLGPADTVVMNPPFGAQRRHADRPFIDLALRLADSAYVVFNAGSLRFVTEYVRGRAVVEEVVSGTFPLRRTFCFHSRDITEIKVEIVRLRRL